MANRPNVTSDQWCIYFNMTAVFLNLLHHLLVLAPVLPMFRYSSNAISHFFFLQYIFFFRFQIQNSGKWNVRAIAARRLVNVKHRWRYTVQNRVPNIEKFEPIPKFKRNEQNFFFPIDRSSLVHRWTVCADHVPQWMNYKFNHRRFMTCPVDNYNWIIQIDDCVNKLQK